MAPEKNEPHTPDNSNLNPEEKLQFINDVIQKTNDLLKDAFSPEQFINDIYGLTCMERDFNVTITERSIKAESSHRGIEEVQWDNIKKISIVTNDKGPFTADVFMALLTDTAGCAIPQGNSSYQELYDKVTAFENVNFESIIKAMSSSENNEFVIWENKQAQGIKMLSYAFFDCNPTSKPPFTLTLGFSDRTKFSIADCAHIPEALEKMEEYCKKENLEKSAKFTLLYPIYMEAMNTDSEGAMHNIAWIIKEKADLNKWNFDRTGGLNNKTPESFI